MVEQVLLRDGMGKGDDRGRVRKCNVVLLVVLGRVRFLVTALLPMEQIRGWIRGCVLMR